MDVECLVWCGSSEGHVALIRKLREKSALVNAKDNDGDTALHIAVAPKTRYGGLDVTVRGRAELKTNPQLGAC